MKDCGHRAEPGGGRTGCDCDLHRRRRLAAEGERRRKGGRPAAEAVVPLVHGSKGYWRACRCEECRAGHAAYERERRRRSRR